MKITTKQFGEIEFEDSKTIEFEEGIIGFENFKKYLLVNSGDELFLWLTSVDEPEIVFPLISIGVLVDDYKYKGKEEGELFGIVTLNKDPLKITVNLKAPVCISKDNKRGSQKILDNDLYPIDYNLFAES
jgi:flagellar assembly factor FliW